MINLLRAEWIKLRTITMNWVLGIIAFAFPLVVTRLTAGFQGDNQGYDTRSLVQTLTGTSAITAIMFGVIATTSITSEYAYGTIRPTFAAVPGRVRALGAKATVIVVSTALVGALVSLIGYVGGAALAEGQGAHIDLAEVPTGVPALVGAVLFAVGMALAGFGLGMAIRSTPASVTLIIAWPWVGEGLVGGLIGAISGNQEIVSWMPFQAGLRLLIVDPTDGPGRIGGGLYFAGFALALTALGGWLVNRSDA